MVRINVISKNEISKSFAKIIIAIIFVFILIISIKNIKFNSINIIDNRKFNKNFGYFFQFKKYFFRRKF